MPPVHLCRGDYRFDDFTMVEAPGTDVVEASYVYDALGRRIEKTVGSATTRYVYHGARVIEEYNGANALQASYVYGNYVDEVVTMRRARLTCLSSCSMTMRLQAMR